MDLRAFSQRYVSLTSDGPIMTTLNVEGGITVMGSLNSGNAIEVMGQVSRCMVLQIYLLSLWLLPLFFVCFH